MSWFLYAIVATLSWGLADIFYKKSSDEDDRYSHLKIAVCVGFVMGVCSAVLLIFSGEKMSTAFLLGSAVRYLPASFSYIASMVIGYAGMRYLELSVISPVQNASGALSTAVMLVFFILSGKGQRISEAFSALDIAGTLIIISGVIMLAFVEKKTANAEKSLSKEERKYKIGALALMFPLLYCVFDTLGTAYDGIILDGESGLSLSEIQVLILYGLTFFFFGLCAYLYMLIKLKKPYNPFSKKEVSKWSAAMCEEFGQFFYVFAMASNPVLAAPMIASYCIVSVLLSRVILKEKLSRAQYLCVITVISGIVLLGISEGLSS